MPKECEFHQYSIDQNCDIVEAPPRVRWCEYCGHSHGYLYPCPYYDKKTLEEISLEERQVRDRMSDPEWVKRQLAMGVTPTGILIMRMFAGLEG